MQVHEIFRKAYEVGASDIHLCVNMTPAFRVFGGLSFQEGEKLTPEGTLAMVKELTTEAQWSLLSETGDIDFSMSIPGVSRYRVNIFLQRGCFSIAARIIPKDVPSLEALQLPAVVRWLANQQSGLVLVTGPTGSGKSTTLAAMIEHINQQFSRHIITLEDPIEYLHEHGRSVIQQREIRADTKDFSSGLRAALRQNPDIILIGELRDLETIHTALTAAETGHLVLSTLHTGDAIQTINRMVDVFPADQQGQIRVQLASVLQGVVSQRLWLNRERSERVAVVEVLVNTPAVANLIRTDKTHQIRSVMQTGGTYGMQTMDAHVRQLVKAERLPESALSSVIRWTENSDIS
ncbi:MAG: type IV pilus twitching motility protein PilT [Alicyclobacillaceae bacterium]|nr:type IV pilus twitching motility protein PilT [Alicyclobacillaceae bacterium]